MSDDLADCFHSLIDGRRTPETFADHLLALCERAPQHAWQALALLDRFFRQRRISDELCRSLRQRIAAAAMRMEGYASEPSAAAPGSEALAALDRALVSRPAPPAAPTVPRANAPGIAKAARVPSAPRTQRAPRIGAVGSRGWARRGVHTTPAVALVCAVLGVAASTKVQDPPAILQAPDAPSVLPVTDPAPPVQEPALISLSSDRYIVREHQRSIELTVQRSGDSAADTSFRWWTEPAGAHSGEDYVGERSHLVRLQPGEDTAALTVRILPNPQRRHIEMFYVVIGSASDGARVGEIHRAAVFVFPDPM